jgi:hypothetical protein
MLGIHILGAATAGYTCSTRNNVFVCVPSTEDRLNSFLLLQNVIQQVSKAMAKSGKQLPINLAEVTVDGRPGPTSTTAAKFIVAVFAGSVPPPPEVAALLDPKLSAEDGIRLLAANSDAIGKYIGDTYRDHPEILRNDPIVIVKEPPKRTLHPVAIPVLGFSLVSIMGLVATAIYLAKGGGDVSVLTE